MSTKLRSTLYAPALFMLCLTLNACSPTRVHLYTEGLEPDKVQDVSDLLSEAGFSVIANTNPIHPAVSSPSLVYPLTLEDLSEIRNIESLLSSAGISVDLIMTSIGNNFYTRKNLGLYLIPYAKLESPQWGNINKLRNTSIVEGKQYAGRCNNQDLYLLLKEDFNFELSLESWDEEKDLPYTTTEKGSWSRGELNLNLKFKDKTSYFAIDPMEDSYEFTTPTGEEKFIQIRGIKLTEVPETDESCELSWRIHQQ